jgi:hypothetical protein
MSGAARQRKPPKWLREFRRHLESVEISSVFTMERSEILLILHILVDRFGQLLAETEHTSTGMEIVKEHVVVSQLRHLVLALEDLDRGLTHEALKSASSQANAALSAEQRESDRLLLEIVAIAQTTKKLPTLRQAEEYIAERLAGVGVKRRGKRITAAVLRSLRDHPKKKLATDPHPE